MPAAIGPRFVLEAGFLVLLAVVVGIADLDPLLIVLVMAIGWLLVSLIEYLAWRQAQGALRRFEAAPVAVTEEEVVDEAPPPPPPPPPPPAPPAEEETIVERAPVEPERPAEEPPAEEPPAEKPSAEPVPAEEAPAEQATGFTAPVERRRVGLRLEPLQPRPKRRWVLFGPYDRRDAPAEDDREEEQ
jgi:hypothetical protein